MPSPLSITLSHGNSLARPRAASQTLMTKGSRNVVVRKSNSCFCLSAIRCDLYSCFYPLFLPSCSVLTSQNWITRLNGTARFTAKHHSYLLKWVRHPSAERRSNTRYLLLRLRKSRLSMSPARLNILTPLQQSSNPRCRRRWWSRTKRCPKCNLRL